MIKDSKQCLPIILGLNPGFHITCFALCTLLQLYCTVLGPWPLTLPVGSCVPSAAHKHLLLARLISSWAIDLSSLSPCKAPSEGMNLDSSRVVARWSCASQDLLGRHSGCLPYLPGCRLFQGRKLILTNFYFHSKWNIENKCWNYWDNSQQMSSWIKRFSYVH